MHAFFIRMWIDEGEDTSWTGRVKSMLDGAERQVRSFAEIETFILRHLRSRPR